MKTFMTYYQTGDYGKLWFEAEDEKQAEYLLSRVEDYQLSIEDLPNVQIKLQGDEIGLVGLKEVSDA